jgi:hypothetical protein
MRSGFPVSLRARVLWCREVRPGYWCLAFPQSASSGLAHHFRSARCTGFAVRPCPAWRSFPPAVCIGFRPPSSWLGALRGLPSGAGGSEHPIGSGLVRF